MSVVGEFTVPSDEFALDHALTASPETAVEAEKLASHSAMEVFPFLWATGGDLEAFQSAVDADPSIEEVTVAEETGDDVLFRLVWSDGFCELINDMVDHHAAILEASASGDHWDLRLRFAEESMISEFQDHFRTTGHRFEVNRLFRPSEPRQRVFGLTAEQHEALTIAVTEGHFSIPRAISVEELGESLGISANATSQRLRRGCDTLIRSALQITDDD